MPGRTPVDGRAYVLMPTARGEEVDRIVGHQEFDLYDAPANVRTELFDIVYGRVGVEVFRFQSTVHAICANQRALCRRAGRSREDWPEARGSTVCAASRLIRSALSQRGGTRANAIGSCGTVSD